MVPSEAFPENLADPSGTWLADGAAIMRLFALSFSLMVAGLVVACGAEVENDTTKADPNGAPPNGNGASSSSGGASGPGSSSSTSGQFCSADDTASCAPARHVASAADLIAESTKLSWQGVALGKSSVLQIGDDLVADADLDVDASLITAPASCKDDPDTKFPRCHAPLFRAYAFPSWSGPPVPGVTCAVVGDHPVRKGDTCSRITIAKGTTFRIRAVVEDMHPSGPTYWPFVEFEKSCATPCADGETRCGATKTCFARGYDSCAFCEGASASTCSCRAGCGTSPDGAECSYDTSPDTVASGTCKSGSCNAR